jgi:DNA-binding transcriptional ArsR family regulator
VQRPEPKMVNNRLAAAVSHPTRVHVMTILADREASPKEIAADLKEPIKNITYHVNQLLELDCIELVRTAPAKGGRVLEHFYRSNRRSWLDEDDWESLGPEERHIFTTTTMRAMSNDINEAMARGTFFDPDDNHLSRTPMVVDQEGWSEVNEVLDQTLMTLLDIRARVAARIAEQGDRGTFPTRVEMLQFRSPSKAP